MGNTLKTRFNLFLGAVGGSAAALGVQMVIYPWIVVSYLGLDARALGLAQMVAMLPQLFFILWGGAISANRQLSGYLKNLYLLYLIPCLAMIAVTSWGRLELWQLLLFGGSFGAISAFVQPARESLIPQLRAHGMQQAVARTTLVQFGAQSLGMMAAGLFDHIGLSTLMVLQGLLFVLASRLIGRTQPEAVELPSSSAMGSKASIAEGLVMVWRHRRLRPLMALGVATGLLGMGAYQVVVPVLAKQVYLLDARFFAAMQLLFIAGILAANGLFLRFSKGFRRPGRALLLSLLMRGGIIASLALLPHFWLVLPIIFIWGLFSGVSMTLGRSMIHEEADSGFNSRVVSIYQLCLFGSAPLGAAFSGLLIHQMGISLTLVTIGLLTSGFALWNIGFSSLWRERRETPPVRR